MLNRLCSNAFAPFATGGRRPKWLASVALGLTFCGALHAQTQPLPEDVAALLQQAKVPTDAVSMLVWPAEGGAARLSVEPDTVRQAASVMKLFTTGVALQLKGPAWRWQTEVGLGGPLSADGALQGPIYIRGHGDPSLVVEQVDLMLARWRQAGIRSLPQGIVLDRQSFNIPPFDPADFDGQPLKPYNAGPDALLMAHQSVTLRFIADPAQPGRIKVAMEPALPSVRLDTNISTTRQPCGDWRESLKLNISPDGPGSWRLQVQGPYPQACGERDWPVLWPTADDYSARLLRGRWQATGGELSGAIVSGNWPEGLPVWQSWPSPPLAEVIRDINKFSNNVMARQLFLSLAGGGPGEPAATLDASRQLVGNTVRAQTRTTVDAPCEGEALLLDNGSGLSRTARSSAACLARWLQVMWRAPTMPELMASLPVTGLDGTTRRFKTTVGRAHIKTGSLDGVAAMAGIVDGDSGQRWVVVGIVNHPRADAARPALDALLGWAQHDKAVDARQP